MFVPEFVKRFLKKRQMINFYKKFIKSGDLCFDVAANVGERTEIFLKLGARVVAIEPQESCIKILKNKFDNNKRVKILKCAIGSIEKEEQLMICDESDECATLSSEFISTYTAISGFHWTKNEKVKVTTLDKLFKLYSVPTFCKIDVEGYESEVFLGMKQKLRYLAFEFNNPLLRDTRLSLEILKSLGSYQCNFIKYEIMKLALNQWLPADEFQIKLGKIISPDILTGEIIVKFL